MTSAVDGLKQRFMAMSQPDADGVYRNGAAKRKARTELAMGNLTQLWNEACEAVSFDVPATGIGSRRGRFAGTWTGGPQLRP